MSTLLHVSASPRGARSESLALAATFLETYREHNPLHSVERFEPVQAIERASYGTAWHMRDASGLAPLDRSAQIAELDDGIVDVVRDARELSGKLAGARLTLASILLR